MRKVFLGGTCNGSKWRERLIPCLEISTYNPVVADWTPECQEEELRQRESCDFCLYVITPKMTGVYSIAEVVDDSNKRPDKTLFCFIAEDEGQEFSEGQLKSLHAVGKMITENGARYFLNMSDVAIFLNDHKEFVWR